MRLAAARWAAVAAASAAAARAADADDRLPLVRFDGASASSNDGAARNALRRGSAAWEPERLAGGPDSSEWTGTLRYPRLVRGVRVHWGRAPQSLTVAAAAGADAEFAPLVESLDVVASDPAAAAAGDFVQVVAFPEPAVVAALRLQLSGTAGGFSSDAQGASINFAALVAAADTPVTLVSGATFAGEETCLQAEADPAVAEATAVELAPCLDAVAAGDGREVFFPNSKTKQIRHVPSGLCLAIKDNNVVGGGSIVLANCNSGGSKDGRLLWEVAGTGQLKSLRAGGEFCLTQEGRKPGFANVALNKFAVSNFPLARDQTHAPAAAVDGLKDTYWASQLFSFPDGMPQEPVDFRVDLGEQYKISKLVITWEFPPISYEVGVSTTGKEYVTVRTVPGNSLTKTSDRLNGVEARYVKLSMFAPHPTLSVHQSKAAYGIVEFVVLANRLRSVVLPCEEATRLSSDDRDLYFMNYVEQVDLSAATGKRAVEQRALDVAERVEEVGNVMEGEMEAAEICHSGILRLRDATNDAARRVLSLESAVRALDREAGALKPDTLPEDCYDAFAQSWPAEMTELVSDGFFDIRRPCEEENSASAADNSLRVLCSRSSFSGVYFWTGSWSGGLEQEFTPLTRTLHNPAMVARTCERLGLLPFEPSSADQVQQLHDVVMQMNVPWSHPESPFVVPLAVVNSETGGFDSFKTVSAAAAGTGTVPEAGATPALTDLFARFNVAPLAASPGTARVTGVGLTKDAEHPLALFEWETAAIGAALCQVPDPLHLDPSVIAATCDDRPRGNVKFEGCPYSSILVKCPDDCVQAANSTADVVGTDLYRDDSLLCLAAKHADALDQHQMVNVTYMPGVRRYGASASNGVRSAGYSGATWDRSFMCQRPPRQRCEVGTKSEKAGGSVPEEAAAGAGGTAVVPGVPATAPAAPATPVAALDPSQEIYEGGTASAVAAVLQQVHASFGSLSLDHIAETARSAIVRGRALVKPSREVAESLSGRLDGAEDRVSHSSEALHRHLQRFLTKLVGHERASARAARAKATLFGFRMDGGGDAAEAPASGAGMWDLFEPWTLDLVDGASAAAAAAAGAEAPLPGAWSASGTSSASFIPQDLLDQAQQTEDLSSEEPGGGGNATLCAADRSRLSTIALRKKRFYDGNVTLSLRPGRSGGLVGVLFRATDRLNLYALLMDQVQGVTELVRARDGHVTILSSVEDGGYVPGQWTTVRVVLQQNRLTGLAVQGEEFSSDAEVGTLFDAADESFASGTVGLIASGTPLSVAGFEFREAVCAAGKLDWPTGRLLPWVPPPPPPPADGCGLFRSEDARLFAEDWQVFGRNPGDWGYRKLLPEAGGGPGPANGTWSITSYNARGNQDGESLLLLKRARVCSLGVVHVAFIPNCDGAVGLVFRYKSARDFALLEIRANETIWRKFEGPEAALARRRLEPGGTPFQTTVMRVDAWDVGGGREGRDGPAASVELLLNRTGHAPWLEQERNVVDLTISNTTGVSATLNGEKVGGFLDNSLDTGRVGLMTFDCGGAEFSEFSMKPLFL